MVKGFRDGFLQKRTIYFRSGGREGVNQVMRREKSISYRWKSTGKDQWQDES